MKFLRRKYAVCGLTRPQFDLGVKYVTAAAHILRLMRLQVTMTHSVTRHMCLVLFFNFGNVTLIDAFDLPTYR